MVPTTSRCSRGAITVLAAVEVAAGEESAVRGPLDVVRFGGAEKVGDLWPGDAQSGDVVGTARCLPSVNATPSGRNGHYRSVA